MTAHHSGLPRTPLLCLALLMTLLPQALLARTNPVLFVAQYPIAGDFATIGSTFANHMTDMQQLGRGGDLYILYVDNTLRNLTREAGFGEANTFQGANAISVRDPHVHWNGQKALFSMVIGAPTQQFVYVETYWQIYEVSGLGQGQTVSITKIPNQPLDYNNITPMYSPDGRIIFTSDRPRNGLRHLYPQHDEYESTPTNTGLWSLDPATGNLKILSHSPSGAFTPIVDSFGRIIYTRWDHLQRDQQAEVPSNQNFDWANENANAPTGPPVEVFPESRTDDVPNQTFGLRFNLFQLWQIHPDGTEEETINHVGRHELQGYFNQSFMNDPNLVEFIDDISGRVNQNPVENFFHGAEDPLVPGDYFGTFAPEFGTHSGGQLVKLTAPPSLSAELITASYITHPDTRTTLDPGDPVPPTHTGHYRNPLKFVDGTMIAAHTPEVLAAGNLGTRANPNPRYKFRLANLITSGAFLRNGTPLLASPIVRDIQFFDPDVLVSYNGQLWELQPVEVRSRPQPPILTASLPSPEATVFAQEGVNVQSFKNYMSQRGLALTVSRDITTREVLDRQQPFNLRVPGGVQTTGAGGIIYDVPYLQFFQGDQVRGIGGVADPKDGRRVLARVMHDPAVVNPPNPTGPAGSVKIALDGSMAAMVPAHRAMTWQLTAPAPNHAPVVRERYWLTFQPGEIRVCASCHGLNDLDQDGSTEPVNPPEALRQLLQFYKSNLSGIFNDGFESGNTSAWSLATP